MWVRSTWGWVAALAWPAAAWADGPPSASDTGSTDLKDAPTLRVGSAALPDVEEGAQPENPPPVPNAPPAAEPAPRLLGPNDNPYRGPSIPGRASFENPYRGPSLKPPYDNPYRGPSIPAESASAAAPVTPAHWGPPGMCPPGSACANSTQPEADASAAAGPLNERAADASPFINAVSGAFLLRDRVSTPLAFGGELGMFVVRRMRLSGRALVPIVSPSDELPGQEDRASRSVWLWGFGAGLVAADGPTFTLAPGVQFVHLAGGRHGNAVGAHVPFEWLLDGGLRLGFDFSVLYGFGGSYRAGSCYATLGDDVCSTRSEERKGAPGVAVNLVLGQAFTSPRQPSAH